MDDFYRVKPKGRYIHKCPTCGVFMKLKAPHCRGCVLDLLGDEVAGTWRAKKPKKYVAHAIALVSDITTA